MSKTRSSSSSETMSQLVNKINRRFLHDASNPYSNFTYLKEIPVLLLETGKIQSSPRSKFSVITTIKNEGDTIRDWFAAIENQTLTPDEIIIVDGGSTDQTLKILEERIKNSKLNYNLIKEKTAGRSKGRNIAVGMARNEIIVSVDGGSYPDSDYFKNMLKAFESDPEIDMVMGIYELRNQSLYDRLLNKYFITDWDKQDHNNLLPSPRSVAYKKKLWKQVGGYPEWLMTGEDTFFDIKYRKISRKWALNKDALVYCEFPRKLSGILGTVYGYGKGDGESGLGDRALYFALKLFERFRKEKNPLKFLALVYLLFLAIKKKSLFYPFMHYYLLKGYAYGRKNRVNVNLDNNRINRNALIIAADPITANGGNTRHTHLSLGLIKTGCKITLVNIYPSSKESRPFFLDTDFTLLELEQLRLFDVDEYVKRHEKILDKTFVLIEFPSAGFVPIVKKLKENKIPIIYDCTNDWSTGLGSMEHAAEKELVQISDILIATSQDLVQRIKSISNGREAILIPNAVNADVLEDVKNHPSPKSVQTNSWEARINELLKLLEI